MENCIVTKGKMGKPFRDLAQHYKVSIPELEKITYKYRKLVGEDNAFPSPTFINAELGKIPYKESPELVENAHKIWEAKYRKDIIFDKDTEAIKSKEEAEALFPKEVIHLYFNSEGKVVLSVQEPVAEIDIKHRKDFPDWQNYNDYLLVMGDLIPESERDKEKKQLGPQPFTFNDGTTVTAPFKPNEQQVEALNAMSDFINSDEVSMTLSGYAGTGKTSLMELIAAKMKKEHKNIVFSASTNKAAAVLRDRVKKAGFTAQTLNKVFGISVEVDSSKPYDAANLVNKLKEAEITPGTIVVIDEASMINEENYRILNDIAKENGLKIIYTGDKGQLAPVRESQISKVFRDKNGRIVTLTKVERTEDNAILKEATAVRNGQPLSGESSFNSEGKGVAYMKPTNKEGKKAIVEAFVPMLKKNPDFFRILAYTNKAVADYNTAVRNALGYHDNIPRVGEPIVGYSNWGAEYDRRTKQTTYRFINSESYKVTEVKPAKQVYYSLDDGTRVQMTAIPITIEDAMGKRDKIDLMDIKGNPQNLQAATILAKEKARLFNVARHLPRREQPAIYQQINAIEKFLFVNDSIKEGGRTLQNKTFDFGYAMTVHKSQGSTFTHVLVDDADISTVRNHIAPSGFDASVSMLDDPYSAMEGAQAVDLGLDSASSDMQVTSQGNLFAQMQQQPKVLNTQTINREANNAANIRQQLEYVAVSRATDTVTIISNNVKTEDSPLNHLKDSSVNSNSVTVSPAVPQIHEEYYTKHEAQAYINDLVAEGIDRNSIRLEHIPATETEDDYYIVSTIQYQDTINQGENRSNKKANLIAATIAPYFNTSYQDYIVMSPEQQKQMREAFSKAAHEVAKVIGITLDMKHVSFNIGGYQFEDGGSVVEPSFTFRLNTTPEKARLFAALMGDLGYEQQEAVVSSYRVEDYDSADGVKHYIKYSDFDTLLPLLEKYGIKNFTYDKTRGELSVLSFDTEEVKNLHKLANNLNKTENGEKFRIQTEAFKSSYDAKNDRRVLYETWDSILRKEQGREGYNSQLHSLIQEALSKLQEPQQATVPEVYSSGQASQKVHLPGYEYFNELYEDTEVDAAWKIPILQDLDSQLSTENTEDENLQILSQMDRVLQSPSQEDYEKAPTPQKEETNKRMEDYLKRNRQLNNLLDNEVGLQASEIRDTAETIMNTISDIITEIQQHPEKATEYWPTLKTNKDLSKVSRKELVEIVNINRLIELAKKRFDDLKWSEDPAVDALYNSAHLLDQHDLIMNNWDAVMRFAGDIFVANEGFGIKRNSKKSNYETEVREYQGYDYDDYSGPQDPDAIAEEGDEQEHWQVEAKTVDVINSMSELVRMAIHNCYVLDKSGNKVLDKWGMPKRVDKHKAVKQILYWTAGTLNINEMIDRLEAHKDRNPWVTQLTKRLADTSGSEADFQSQFYGVMHRHFQLYGIGQYEDGHYVHKILNRHNALSEVMKGISAQFQMHQHPLFNKDSTINRESLKLLEGWYGVLEAIKNKHKLMLVKSSGEGSREDYVSSNNLELSETDIEAAAKAITAASRMLGYMTTEEQVLPIINKDSILRMTNALMLMLDHEGLRAQAQANTKDYKPFGFKTKNNIRGALNKFLQPMMEELEETALNTIFEDGKMYQSNTIPSFLSQLFDSFAQSEENFKPWVESFYGNSQWFKKDGIWRTPWLATMMSNPDARKIFEHHVQLNFNKHNYMRNMSPDEYIISCITNYFFKTTDEKEPDTTEAWFRVPIQSNKPSSEFIKFFSFRGTDYKDKIVAAMQSFFLQELDRIDTVRKRNKQEEDASAIASWDEHGRHFMFMPFLNSYLVDKGELVNKEGNDLFRNADGTIDTQKNNELKILLNKKLNAEKDLTPDEEVRLSKLVEEATRIYMQGRAGQILDNYEKNGILKAAEKVENIKDYGRSVRDNIENFIWNDFFAANNILQLTITDKAFYPTTAELQKRLAELHAPGTKANKYATDYKGNRISDGTYRTILISDYEGFTANIIDNLTEIFNRKIAQASQDEKQAWIALKESLVGKDGRYRKINVTDGQAYSSPSSYRKKMLMFGKWSPEAERTYQKIRSGNFTLSDLEAVFQPLKPFVYGHLHKKMGVQKAPIQEMNVPFQAKNSEYLLLMADALMQGQETSRPNLLHTIYNIMEESERLFPTKGIDTVQFNSAIKSGAQGVVHLSDFTESGAGREQAYTALREQMYVKNDKGEIVDYNYDTFVQSTDYDNYALQQEVPKHFQDHQQAEPSQKRANIMSDLDMWLNPQGDKADPANINYYTWKDPDGTEHKLNAQEFRKEYEEVHAKNIEDSFNDLAKLFHLDSLDRVERNIAISELLQEEIESSPRYGIDLMQACQIDPKTGDFRIPKGDPVQSKRIEQLINSIIKSRVNKQKLAGGPVVQVTNWGTSRQLHIRFNDKNDNLLPTKEEYESLVSSGKISSSLSYKDYIKENQAGIAHFEIFAPAAWKKHLEKFKNPDGTINLEAVEKCDPNLLRMITSRIPNEDKYSIAHGKIVGFLPEVAGEAIMFPYELTEIDDSDFDVDKRYCHVFEIEDIVEDTPKVRELLFKAVNRSYKKSHDGAEMPYNFKKKVNDSINMLLDNPEVIRHTDKFSENLYNAYQNILHTEFPYKVKYPKKGSRGDRNNQILNMDWAVMSNEMTASKILNPGGFDIPKHDAYVIAVYRAKNGSIKWEQLEGMTTKQLQKLMPTAGDLAWFDTQVQFYKQNAAGSNLIGVFAVNKVAHAILEADDILVDIEDVCGKGNTFTIADKEFKGRIPLDSSQDDSGAYIGKGLGSMVGASADTAKDPWLDLIGINMTTAGVYNTLLRLGMPQKDAALFMSQDAIVSALNEFNRTNLEETTTFDTVISKKLAVLRNKYGYNENSEINKEPITREELKAGLLQNSFYANDYKDKVDYKVLLAFSRLQNLAKAIRKPTLVTRLNSISSAVGPLIIDNIILEHKLMQFLQSADQEVTGFYSSDGATVDMDDIFYNHPMLKAFFKAFQFASNRFSDMPAGSTGFKNLIEAFPESIREKLYEDRQLLSKLSDFYQSYMLVANGIINPEQIGNYINGFPDYFIKSKFKEKYPDNAFIQAIQITFDKKAGRGFLNINTTGMMEQEKERLRMAWTDLHKVNPKLSTQLFTYAFFRGGIGFSPKTWMGLVSTYVKEHLTNQRADSAMTSYVDTYRNFPTERMVDSTIMKQFVRNNWDNSKLAPKKGGEGTAYDYSSLSQGILRVHSQKDMKDLQGIPFMRTVIDKKTYLWERVTPMEDTDSSIEFRRIMPLGNNGEYVEMSLEEDMSALENVEELRQNNEQPELPSNAQKDAATSDDSSAPVPAMSVTEQAKSITDIVKYMITSRGLNEKVAVDYVATLHKKAQDGTISKFSKQDIQRIAKDNGLNLDVDTALEWFKKLC